MSDVPRSLSDVSLSDICSSPPPSLPSSSEDPISMTVVDDVEGAEAGGVGESACVVDKVEVAGGVGAEAGGVGAEAGGVNVGARGRIVVGGGWA